MFSERAVSKVRVNNEYSNEFSVQREKFSQGSVLSPLLFIIVVQLIIEKFKTCCPWKLLYVDDLINIAESAKELIRNEFPGVETNPGIKESQSFSE